MAANVPGSTNGIWSTGGQIDYSTAALGSNGVFYIGSKDNRLWSFNANGSTNRSWLTQGIVQGSPAIGSDGTIYVGSGDYNFYAFNPDGTTQHVWHTGGEVYSSPAIGLDGTIYVGSYDQNFYAFNPDGTTQHVWKTTGGIDCSPAIGGDGTIYVGAHTIDGNSGSNALYAFNPDGTTQHVWQLAGNVFYSSPAIGSDGVIYVGCVDTSLGTNGKLYTFNQDGTTGYVWNAGGGFASSPAIGTNGTIYIGRGDGAVFGFNPDGTTQKVWSVPISGFGLLASPTIGADGTIYIGANGNRFYALNPNGATALVYNVGNWIYSGSALDSNGTVYVGCRDNKVYAFAGTGGGLADSPWPKFRSDARNTGRSPLLAPSNVTATKGMQSSYVTISWSGLTNAKSYEVWRSGVASMAQATMIAQTNGTSIDDNVGVAAPPYYYWIKARYSRGNSCLRGGNPYINTRFIAASAGPNGSITPAGNVPVDVISGTNFLILASNYFHISSVLSNGIASPISDLTNMTLAWSSVTADGTVTVSFAENLCTNNTPEWWLAQHGLTNFNVDAMRDVDHDGMLTWQEWVAGCDPTNINSVFRFTRTDGAIGQGMVVRWPSISNRFYTLSRTTNLITGTNAFVILPSASNMPATPMQNSYTDSVQGLGPFFYRIDVRR